MYVVCSDADNIMSSSGSGDMPGSVGGGSGNTLIPFCVGADGQPTQCLDRSQICDGIPDCIDNSDETSGFCIGGESFTLLAP